MTRAEFRTIRKALGLTQLRLASMFGVGVDAVKRWEASPDRPASRTAAGTTERLMLLMEKRPVVAKWLGEI